MKVVAIVQARMGSTRLPGKVMLDICGKTVLEHVITRVRQSEGIDEIVIATTNEASDSILVEEAKRLGVKYFRGSEEDVLSRYYYAAKEKNADAIVRITSDCPLIDPVVTGKVINKFKEDRYELVTNAGNDISKRTYPRGLDVTIFSYKILKDAFLNANKSYQREHVTPYMYENFDAYRYKNNSDYSNYRLTLDTIEDYNLIKKIYQKLYFLNNTFNMKDIINLFIKEPELLEINQHIQQKKV